MPARKDWEPFFYNEEKTTVGTQLNSRADISLDGDRAGQTGEYRLAPRDLELCAISYALEKFRVYLAGNKFTVASDIDHRSLEVLESSKINNGRLARILEQLSEFDFKIEYNEGTSPIITVADALSRLPRYRKVLEEDTMDDSVGEISNIEIDADNSTNLEDDDKKQMELFEILGLEEEPDGEQHREKRWGTSVLASTGYG